VFSLQHQLTALLNQLQSLSPELASVQSVSIQSQATLEGEIQEQGLKVQIQKLDNRIGQGNQTWFSLGSPAPWSLQTHKEQSLPEFRDLQIELQLHNLPLPLMRAFVPDLQANASSSKGRFLLQSRGKGWVLQNPEPLSLQQFSLN